MFLKHQNQRINNLFSAENRLIYEDKVPQQSEDILASEPSARKLEQDLEAAKKKLSENEAKIYTAVAEYNKKFGEPPSFRKPQPYEEQLIVFQDNPDASIKQIERILNARYEVDGIFYKIKDRAPSQKREGQAATLLAIQKLFLERIRFHTNEKGVDDEELVGHRRALVFRSREVEKQKETVTKWGERTEYQDLENDYKNIIGKFLKDPRYKQYYEGADGNIDPTRERQNKQLFFAILARETNGFTSDFVLSKFSQDNTEKGVEENKKNYPFIYYEWLTKFKGFNADEMVRAEEAAKAKENEVKVKGSDVIKNLNKALKPENPDFDANAIAKISQFKNNFEELDNDKSTPKNKEYYERRIKAWSELRTQISLAIKKLNKNNPSEQKVVNFLQTNYLDGVIKDNEALEDTNYRFKNLEETRAEIDKGFTRSNLSKKENRYIVMELAMLQFQKAMDIADQSFKVGGRVDPLIQPGIRRLLVTTIYYEGVARYNPTDKTGKYLDTKGDEHNWLVSKLIQSRYFNRSLKMEYRDREHAEFMAVAHFANMAVYSSEHLKKVVIPGLENLQKNGIFTRVANNILAKRALPANSPQIQDVQKDIDNDIREIQRWTSVTVNENNAGQILGIEKDNLKTWEGLIKKTDALFANPSPEEEKRDPKGWMERKKLEIRKFIDSEIKNAPGQKLYKLSNPTELTALTDSLVQVSINFNVLKAKEMRTDNYLEKMGIVPDYVFKGYQEFIKGNTGMKVDQWDNLLMSKDGTKKLLEMFNTILPPSSEFRGREDFLRVFETLQGINPIETKPPVSEDQRVAINLYTMMKAEVRKRESMSSLQGEALAAAKSKMDGMTFGEKITDYTKGIIDMVIGPGQTIANRAAGAAILFMVLKMAKSAWDGKTNMGKAMRVVFLAGATELALKHITGEGVLDKLKLDGVAKALAVSYEGVLMDRAEKREVDISADEHGRALMELRNVPFDKVMEWYEATDANGAPLNAKDSKSKLPRGINIHNILPGKVDENKETKGRRIVKKTIENFFFYVGNKEDGKDSAWGHRLLKEVWVQSIKDKKFALKNAEFTRRELQPFLIDRYRRNPKELTWQTVMEAEVRLSDVEDLKKKSLAAQVKDTMESATGVITRWTQRDVINRAHVGADKFWKNVSEDYVPKIEKFIGSMGDAAAVNLKYYENKVELWYDNNKMTLRRLANDHWEIITAGIKLPFEILYGADQLIVPWAGMKLRQLREIFRPDSVSTLDHDLRATDIWIAERPGETPQERARNAQERKKLNHYFGLQFRPAFERALANYERNVAGGADPKTAKRFYETKGPAGTAPDIDDMPKGIAYYISETTQEQASVQPTDKDTSDILNKMQIAAADDALKTFRIEYPHMSEEKIKEHMYPIHVYSKLAARGQQPPEKIYTFWRLTTPESDEYKSKEDGKWTDYYNPNKFKNRPAFIVRPEEGLWYNITTVAGLRDPWLRNAADKATAGVIAQALRFYAGFVERAGGLTASVMEMWKDPKDVIWLRELTTMSEKSRQRIDEWLGSAGNSSLALSDFYKEPENAKRYQAAFERALRDTTEFRKLNLGGLDPTKWKAIDEMEYDKRTGKKKNTGKKVTRLNLGDFAGPVVLPATEASPEAGEAPAQAPATPRRRRRGRRRGGP